MHQDIIENVKNNIINAKYVITQSSEAENHLKELKIKEADISKCFDCDRKPNCFIMDLRIKYSDFLTMLINIHKKIQQVVSDEIDYLNHILDQNPDDNLDTLESMDLLMKLHVTNITMTVYVSILNNISFIAANYLSIMSAVNNYEAMIVQEDNILTPSESALVSTGLTVLESVINALLRKMNEGNIDLRTSLSKTFDSQNNDPLDEILDELGEHLSTKLSDAMKDELKDLDESNTSKKSGFENLEDIIDMLKNSDIDFGKLNENKDEDDDDDDNPNNKLGFE